jgi:hypothetical protein
MACARTRVGALGLAIRDDPVLEFGDPTVEPPFARFRQAHKKPAADDALRLAFHDRAGGRISVAVFQIDLALGSVAHPSRRDFDLQRLPVLPFPARQMRWKP